MSSAAVEIQIQDGEDKEVWEDARLAVAFQLGVDPEKITDQTVVRELAEEYTGRFQGLRGNCYDCGEEIDVAVVEDLSITGGHLIWGGENEDGEPVQLWVCPNCYEESWGSESGRRR